MHLCVSITFQVEHAKHRNTNHNMDVNIRGSLLSTFAHISKCFLLEFSKL